MDHFLSAIILILFFLPLISFFLYWGYRSIKYWEVKKLFEKGTINVQAVVFEIFKGSKRRGGCFYIVRAKYTDDEKKEYKYRSKRLSKKPDIKVGDNVDVTVASTNFSAYKLLEI